MVDLSDFLYPEADEPGDDEPEDDERGDGAAEAQDLVALKACLKALADAIASTNLAVLNTAQGDPPAAGARVQASVAALKRFHEAFQVLDAEPAQPTADADDADA